RPDVILFEANAAFAGIKDLLVRHARFGPKVKGITQSKDKASRVSAFSVPVENGSFRLKGTDPRHVDPGQQELFDEMTTFPFGEHDDLLDAAASGTAYLLERPEPRVWRGRDFAKKGMSLLQSKRWQSTLPHTLSLRHETGTRGRNGALLSNPIGV